MYSVGEVAAGIGLASNKCMEALALQFISNRFGKMEYEESQKLSFPQGLVGFPDMQEFFLHRERQIEPLCWLVSLDDPDLAFMVVDPFTFFNDYEVNIRLPHGMRREMGEERDLLVLGIITVHPDFSRSTINLLAPLVLNLRTSLGWQVILDNEELCTRTLLFPAAAPAQQPLAVGAGALTLAG